MQTEYNTKPLNMFHPILGNTRCPMNLNMSFRSLLLGTA